MQNLDISIDKNLLVLKKIVGDELNYFASWDLQMINSIIYKVQSREPNETSYTLFISIQGASFQHDVYHQKFESVSLSFCESVVNLYNEWKSNEEKKQALIVLKSNNPFASIKELSKQYDELKEETLID